MKTVNRQHAVLIAATLLGLVLYASPLFYIVAASIPQPTDFEFGSIYTRIISEDDAVASKLVFVGDVLLARDVEQKMSVYGTEYPLVGVQASWEDAYVLANFEAAVPQTHEPTKALEMKFSVATENLEALVGAGVTHVSLANNHALDYEHVGFANTSKSLSRRGFNVIGSPEVVSTSSLTYLELGNRQIALLAIHAVAEYPEKSSWQSVLRRASLGSDLQVVYIHWGEEYQTEKSKAQANLAHELIDAGADVIVGHHPHVVQPIEVYNSGLIFYSLGNFVFDQYFDDSVQTGLQIVLEVAEDNYQFTLQPVVSIDTPAQPRFMSEEDKSNWLQALADRSSGELADQINDGSITFQPNLAVSP